MIGDLKKRASFARVVNYVNNPKKARLIDSKDGDVRPRQGRGS